jgi:uncharacterized protein YukE
MTDTYPFYIDAALGICRKVGAGDTAQSLISQLWGNIADIDAAAQHLKDIGVQADKFILGETGLKTEVDALDDEKWSGEAKKEYKKWVNDLVDHATKIKGGIWQIGNILATTENTIKDLQGDLELMCVALVAATGGAVAAAKGGGGAAEATVAAVGVFIYELWQYRNTASSKFREHLTELQQLKKESDALVPEKYGTVKIPYPVPVAVPEYGPGFPTDKLGDWRNWGQAKPARD